jgi:hypothetical protein
MNSRRNTLLGMIVAIFVGGIGQSVDAGESSTRKLGYVLITIKSDLGGILPIKPDSFWGAPQFLPLVPERHYLLGFKPGGYSFGGLVASGNGGWQLGWSTFNKAPFKVQAGKVVYLGEHAFSRTSGDTYSWHVSDTLSQTLAGLNAKQQQLIEGLPIEKEIPMNASPESSQ